MQTNAQLERMVGQLQKQIEEMQAREKRDNSTDYSSLQESVKILKVELNGKEKELGSLKDEYSSLRKNISTEKSRWEDQLKALKQIGLDL